MSAPNKFSDKNFGQPIATNNNGVFILKKIDSKPNAIENYRNCVIKKETITKTQAEAFLQK